MEIISRREYDRKTLATRRQRLEWFRKARLGMFIHYGLFSQLGRGEWVQTQENYSPEEYAELAKTFAPKEGCADEWCRRAKEMGAKYAVLTTRHHEGFSLWNSKVNPFNSYNYCGRDIVREFVDACRKYDLRIGLYSSVMDWHHPDGGTCAYDPEARARFIKYIEDLNVELLSNYGKIDVLWYDMPWPMSSSEAWDSVNRNNRLRALQPDILINNRSRMEEDFVTPEEAIKAEEGKWWEACMTFNGFSWGYVDSNQAAQYSYRAGQILKMLRSCVGAGGNLLLNIGPTADGSVPDEVNAPLDAVGAWLAENGEAVYGEHSRFSGEEFGGNGITQVTASDDRKTLYFWNYFWQSSGKLTLGGYQTAPKKVSLLATGAPVDFKLDGDRLMLSGLPTECPDKHVGITVIKAEFDEVPSYSMGSRYPQIHGGELTYKGTK